MRSNFGSVHLTVFALAAVAVGYANPALAWSRHHDRVYADSFGNLVVDSAAGYKSIIVGEGAMAGKLAEYTGGGQAEVLTFDETEDAVEPRTCYRPPVLVKGRSYMYGLSDGEMPELSPCQ